MLFPYLPNSWSAVIAGSLTGGAAIFQMAPLAVAVAVIATNRLISSRGRQGVDRGSQVLDSVQPTAEFVFPAVKAAWISPQQK